MIADTPSSYPGIFESQKTWHVSPELSSTLSQRAENQEDPGRQYDVWCLGCIFLEILVTMFGARDQSIPRQLSDIGELWYRPAATGKAHLKPEVHDTFNNLFQLDTGLPVFEELLKLVWDTLEVDHKRRLSIQELRDGLASILARTPGSAFFTGSIITIADITESEDFDESERPTIISASFEQRITSLGFSCPYSRLFFHPVVPINADIFTAVLQGDMNWMLELLSTGMASLRDCDLDGKTLLNVCIQTHQNIAFPTNIYIVCNTCRKFSFVSLSHRSWR